MKAQNNNLVKDQDGNSSKPLLANRFFFRYKSRGENYNVVIESNSIKNAMIRFLDGYHQIEEIYSIYQLP
ncbi:MAG: hypothetical protein RL308_3396 [Bacteroidota bacterium]|jgi:hypothetical protein